MYKKTVGIFGCLFILATLLWSGEVSSYRVADNHYSGNVDLTETLAPLPDGNPHSIRYIFTALSVGGESSDCLIGDNNGGRYSFPVSLGRLLSTIRPIGGQVGMTRGGFLLFGDLRSLYGIVRSHLFFCRLQN